MSQRFCLFYAGYTACAPALYYEQLELAGQVDEAGTDAFRQRTAGLADSLDTRKSESETFLDTAISIAAELDVKVPEKPGTVAAYISWKQTVTSLFEQEFPMTRIDHYYFLFGRRLAEMVANMELLKVYIVFLHDSEKSPMLLRKADKALKDTEYILFKMMAPAALLSGEHRHHYFSVYYKEINTAFRPFASVDVRSLGDEELQKLSEAVSDYLVLVTNGFKKCISLLKELGV